MGKFQFVLAWYATVICTLVFSLLMLLNLAYPRIVSTPHGPSYQMYKALPSDGDIGTQTVEIGMVDARALIINDFFLDYKAPLAKYSDKFMEVAEKYSLDWRLLPAISMQESGGGKRVPSGSYNPFGYKADGKLLQFFSYEDAIDVVSEGLKKDYIDLGLQTPEEIVTIYKSAAVSKNGTWAKEVSAYMSEMY